jgi:hypothetical protein
MAAMEESASASSRPHRIEIVPYDPAWPEQFADIFTMFRQRMDSRARVGFDELRSTPTQVLVTARVNGSDPVVTVFSFQGRHIVGVKDDPSMEAAEAAVTG